MNSVLTDISKYESGFIVDNYKAQLVLSNCKTIAQIKEYLENILYELKKSNYDIIDEAKNVAIPLSYRLALDDTSSNYRISSEIKEELYKLEFSEKFRKCVKDEIDWICETAFGFSYYSINQLLEDVYEDLQLFSNSLNGNWFVYGRSKNISSILSKLAKFKNESKRPKDKSEETKELINKVLTRFENNISLRMENELSTKIMTYSFNDVKWLITDLVAFTIQLKEGDLKKRNLGSAKATYKSVLNKMLLIFPNEIFFGPSYSNNWHMSRMVCYIEYKVGSSIKIPFELFIRTDYDYYVGYGNYWRYKDINLFLASSQENEDSRLKFNRMVRDFKRFEEVQEALFKEITTGQLDLF